MQYRGQAVPTPDSISGSGGRTPNPAPHKRKTQA